MRARSPANAVFNSSAEFILRARGLATGGAPGFKGSETSGTGSRGGAAIPGRVTGRSWEAMSAKVSLDSVLRFMKFSVLW